MAQREAETTPMMKQFRDIKNQYPDALLLFRCGDFYETYCEDAVRAAKELNITLTHRNNGGNAAAIDMAGFPFHALDTYLPKLVRAGLRVAICDQLEDPKLTKKLVKRGVTELVTPGVSYSDTTLKQKENTFVACVHFHGQEIGVSFLDISTGEFLVAQGKTDYIDKLLTNFAPKEVLYMRGKRELFESHFGNRYFTFELDDWMMTAEAANDRLTKQFNTTNLKGFGIDQLPEGVIAAGAILHYLDMTQHLQNGHIQQGRFGVVALLPENGVQDVVDAGPEGEPQGAQFNKRAQNIVVQGVGPVDVPRLAPHVHQLRHLFKAQALPQRRQLVIGIGQAPEHVPPHHIHPQGFQEGYQDAAAGQIQIDIEEQEQGDARRQDPPVRVLHLAHDQHVQAHQRHGGQGAAL